MSTPSDEPAGRATVSHPEAKPEGGQTKATFIDCSGWSARPNHRTNTLISHLFSSLPLCLSVRVDPWNFMFDVHHNPCFRHSLLWGGGMGATLALHSAIRHRNKKQLHAYDRIAHEHGSASMYMPFTESSFWCGLFFPSLFCLCSGSPMKAANAFMLTFTFISGASWLVCRSSQREEQKQMKHLVDLTLAKQANTKKEGATPAAPETGNK